MALPSARAIARPNRIYVRDGYWILQALLAINPGAIVAEIDRLADGVQPGGKVSSGVIVAGPAQVDKWEWFRKSGLIDKMQHRRPGDW